MSTLRELADTLKSEIRKPSAEYDRALGELVRYSGIENMELSLCAAAPELLAACQAARDFICTDGVCDSCGGSLKDGELPPHTGCVCGPILGALKKAGVSDR